MKTVWTYWHFKLPENFSG